MAHTKDNHTGYTTCFMILSARLPNIPDAKSRPNTKYCSDHPFQRWQFWGFIPRKDFNIWKSFWDGAYRCRPAKKEFRRQTLTLEERLWLSIHGMQTPQSPLIATATLMQLMHVPHFLVNRCGEVVPHMVWILRGESPRRKNLMHAEMYCANADLYFAIQQYSSAGLTLAYSVPWIVSFPYFGDRGRVFMVCGAICDQLNPILHLLQCHSLNERTWRSAQIQLGWKWCQGRFFPDACTSHERENKLLFLG